MSTAPVCLPAEVRPQTGAHLLEIARRGVAKALATWNVRTLDRDDLVQETLVRFWQRYPEAWPTGHAGLVFQIARSVTVDAIRRETALKAWLLAHDPSRQGGPRPKLGALAG